MRTNKQSNRYETIALLGYIVKRMVLGKTYRPLICLPWTCDPEEVHKILQSIEHIHEHFQGRQNRGQPLCKTEK